MSTLRVNNLKSRTGAAVTITSGHGLDVEGNLKITGVSTFSGITSFTNGANVTGVTTFEQASFAQNAEFTGILTATTFSGNITGVAATFTGALTYEDVTNVDSVGVVTARQGIRVGAGKSIGSDSGTVTYYGTGTNLTALNAGSLGSGTVPTARLGSGTANTDSFLRGDNSWQPITSKVLQVKFKESTSTRFSATSGNWTKIDGSSGGLQESITPSAVGNTIVVQMYLSMQVQNNEHGGVTISVHDGSSYISMIGESGSQNYYAPSAILGDNNRFNEMLSNGTGGTLWWPVMIQGRHLTTNTNSHTINLYVRMGSGDFYFGDNGAANSMIIWEIEGDIGN